MASFLLSASPPHLHRFSPRKKVSSSRSLPPLKPSSSPNLSPVPSHPKLVTRLAYHKTIAKSSSIGSRETEDPIPDETLLGEDSAAFQLIEQKISSWVYFTVILGTVLVALNILWINPSTGFGTAFVDSISNISGSPEVSFVLWEPFFSQFNREKIYLV
jgi:zeta-carotene isomerase